MSLYNCKADGDHWRISKFTNDLDVEASYLTSNDECDCPAGHRPVCRHRIMLPRFIAKNAVAGQWFHNYEQNQWIRATSDDEPDTLGDLASAASELTATEVDERIRDYQGPIPGDGLIGAMVDSTMKAINLLELAKPSAEAQAWSTIIGENVVAVHDGTPIVETTSERLNEMLEPKPLRRL